MTSAILYIALIVVAFIIFWKIRKGRCGPKCRPPKTSKPEKRLTHKEKMEEIRKKIEQKKGKGVKDIDLFGDFIDKGKKKKGGKE